MPEAVQPKSEARSVSPHLQCKDCKYWYGAEDEEIGPCQIKHIRGDKAYLTHGMHECDEDEVRNAARD